MKVLYIADISTGGGATKSMLELVLTLRDKYGIKVIICTQKKDKVNDYLDSMGIENHAVGHGAFMIGTSEIKWIRPIKYIIRFFQYIANFRLSIYRAEKKIDFSTVDIIHTNVNRNDLGAELAYRHKIKHVWHIREFGEEDFSCWSYRPYYTKYMTNHADCFIAISEAVKKSWIAKGINKDKIQTVYNGVDILKIKKAKLRTSDSRCTLRLVIVGNISSTKGQYQAIEALEQLDDDIKENVSLDIIGSGNAQYIAGLKNKINTKHLGKQVALLGERDAYTLLQNYDVGLMCSRSEGFGRVTVEYMIAGLGVIASDAGANPELISNGRDGLLYHYGDTKDLAAKITYYYKHPQIMSELAEAGYKKATEQFSKENNAANIYTIYCSIIRN